MKACLGQKGSSALATRSFTILQYDGRQVMANYRGLKPDRSGLCRMILLEIEEINPSTAAFNTVAAKQMGLLQKNSLHSLKITYLSFTTNTFTRCTMLLSNIPELSEDKLAI